MVSKLRIIWKQTVAAKAKPPEAEQEQQQQDQERGADRLRLEADSARAIAAARQKAEQELAPAATLFMGTAQSAPDDSDPTQAVATTGAFPYNS